MSSEWLKEPANLFFEVYLVEFISDLSFTMQILNNKYVGEFGHHSLCKLLL